MTNTIIIDDEGNARWIYNDSLKEVVKSLGKPVTKRASHIEPDDEGNWYIDLSPVGGPLITGIPTKEEALKKEEEWLLEHKIPTPI